MPSMSGDGEDFSPQNVGKEPVMKNLRKLEDESAVVVIEEEEEMDESDSDSSEDGEMDFDASTDRWVSRRTYNRIEVRIEMCSIE